MNQLTSALEKAIRYNIRHYRLNTGEMIYRNFIIRYSEKSLGSHIIEVYQVVKLPSEIKKLGEFKL